MTTRRHGLFLAVALLSALLSGGLPKAGSAAEPVAFDAKAFEAAQDEGRPILVQISAPWCPICRTQKPIVAALSAEPRFKLVVCSEPRATPEVRRAYAQDRDRLNEIMRQNKEHGWQPWFEVEEGVNGAVQLVFAPQGVDKAQWADFFQKLTRGRPYAGATWVEVR